MPVSHFFISKWHCNRMPTIHFKIVFAKSVCLYLGCFPLCCAESALCSRWTLDRQSKSRRDNSSRLASYLSAPALLPALVLHPSGGSLSNKRRKPPRFFAIRRLLQWRLSDNRFLDADSVSEKRQQEQVKTSSNRMKGKHLGFQLIKKLLKMQHY